MRNKPADVAWFFPKTNPEITMTSNSRRARSAGVLAAAATLLGAAWFSAGVANADPGNDPGAPPPATTYHVMGTGGKLAVASQPDMNHVVGQCH